MKTGEEMDSLNFSNMYSEYQYLLQNLAVPLTTLINSPYHLVVYDSALTLATCKEDIIDWLYHIIFQAVTT